MTLSENRPPQTVTTTPSEAEAAMIVSRLADYGIQAQAVGGFTSGFRAEAPGTVAVTVRAEDYDRAVAAWEEIRGEKR